MKRRLHSHHILARLEDSLALFVMPTPPFDATASTKQASNVKGGLPTVFKERLG